MSRAWLSILLAAAAGACGGSDVDIDPTDVVLGETTFVVVVNPVVNSGNDTSVPTPGPIREDVTVREDRLRSTTGPAGVAVLSPVAPGNPVLSLHGSGIDGELEQPIREGDLVEVALAADGDDVREMARVVYAFGGQVVEIGPESSVSEVNSALSGSNRIVLLSGGLYEGDLDFSGSNVTLFGAGVFGGEVTLLGDVTISGSNNRIRGATIDGELTISGSDVGVSFSTFAGGVDISGSDSVLLENSVCAGLDISGSGTALLGNRGIDGPLPADCL